MTPVAQRLAPLLESFLGGPVPVRIRAWDGSEAGPADAPLVRLRSRRALRRLLWQPGELGLAEAYINGEIDIEGDLADGLRAIWRAARETGLSARRPHPAGLARAALTAVGLGAFGPPPPAPGSRARLRGRLHSTDRDRAAISHHYDLTARFYELFLDPSMAYSCAYWSDDDPDYTLADAQYDKLELICRKLALEPGARLLDIGCGWGSLALHAAEHHKVRVTAVTLARAQYTAVRERARERGLDHLIDVQLRHYRDIAPGRYDAVATIEMGEHVGDAEYPAFATQLHDMVRPHGRVLIQQMSRGVNAPGGGPFIETYIAPDMHMRPLADTIGLLERAGLEVRHTESLREHYVRTIEAWHRTLEDRRQDAVDLVGPVTARVWRLYLVGGALAFEERRMGVDQILTVRPDARGGSGSGPATAPPAWHRTAGAR
ncbi:SAM-dependent methyltransferase [Streptomyces purpurogeneiscleroticus]|uniref:SAM-dependent methyltransferase n=1 Tax=Streptomyces purpurogeneiscleroticus TaxID=68259 RepID=UPI001CBFFF2C|nr:cyclopropane-fatty-acyl-phospholipid synthase family protein [Streptomyces purpurogeneiscleroticus]MBZ4017775.1 SAM-dependent methyltransferase [Streptomyces purpurogeneiscleroticus]